MENKHLASDFASATDAYESQDNLSTHIEQKTQENDKKCENNNFKSEEPEKTQEKDKVNRLIDRLADAKGSFIAILSAFFVSIGGIFYKKAITMNGSDNSVLRYTYQLIAMLALLKYKKIPILGPKEHRKLLFARSCVGAVAVISLNFGLKYIDPSDNIAIMHTNVIITAILAKILLKEKFTIFHFISVVVTLGGVILITKPVFLFHKETKSTFNDTICKEQKFNYFKENGLHRLIGVIFTLVGAFGSAGLHIFVRKLCIHNINYAVTTLYGTFLGLPASIMLSLILALTGTHHTNMKCELKYLAYDIIFGTIGSIFAILGVIMFIISLKYEDATKVAILRTIDVLFSFTLQFVILNINSDLLSILGALAILLGTLLALSFKFFKAKNETSG